MRCRRSALVAPLQSRFKNLPTQEELNDLLSYNAETGALYWRERPESMFQATNCRSALNVCAVWNSRYANGRAGTDRRYTVIKINFASYLAHRVIWKMVYGEEPIEVDHINRNKLDNRLSNLRSVDHGTNMRNRSVTSLNTSGFKHISWSKNLNKWVVQLKVPGKGQRQIAWKDSLEEAVAARNEAYSRFGYNAELEAA